MGLDTSHGCWSGPYSTFMEWRIQLHAALGGEPTFADLDNAWKHGRYEDQSVPVHVLMNHSDCDGEIAAKDCGPLADALADLLPRLPAKGWYREATWKFIAGLRDAAALGEPVEFR